MAIVNNLCVIINVSFLLVFLSVSASAERQKTVEFNVKPGGVVHTFTEAVKEYECSFTYASQGGTNEASGEVYLFFTQFKAELKGTKIKFANAYSQTAGAGHSDVPLKPEEFTIGESTVTHTDGKFSAQLSKLTAIGQTRHDEL
ncbi:Myeloid-derived growth factor [Dissostichus eleginoides]|uniref:Myeloid-derived growth factor n=1 Tax=Dissostichus eleginoides TaxID=100907 RepID=A0AAD9CB99_DISEL|nr:Myeloid-derived growth factor [Dissostichus eleginoides]